ncbi:MAG: glycosyl transferase family 1 [Nitrospirales bacterium]|nr:MAG: glycosyl transferase family 1 [Nitrospirales bacterium]
MHEQLSEKIKVVRVIARLNIGGPAKQALYLTHRLNGRYFQSSLITGVVGRDEEKLTFPDGGQDGEIHVLPLLGREISMRQDIRIFVELCKIFKAVQPDIVHTHTAKAGTLGRLAAMYARVPITVHTFHGHVFRGYFGRVKTLLFILIEKVLAYFTDRIVVLSESQRRELTDEFHIAAKGKFQVIPLGFNLTPFTSCESMAEARHALTMDSKAFSIGFVGRLVPIKNPLLLLQAYCQAEAYRQTSKGSSSATCEPWSIIIAGGGELLDVLQSEVQAKELSRRVLFCGWQHHVEQVYAAVNVVVLTSLNEGTPVALIEAMASGKPFIATNVGGVIDLMVGPGSSYTAVTGGMFTIYQNGILVESQDAVGLAGAMLYLAAHPEEAVAMGRVGREFSVKLFDEQRLLGDIRGLYQDLLAEKGIQFDCV